MHKDVLILAASIFFLGVLLMGLAIPLVLGKVPPNRIYGFRTPKTLSDPSIWYAANRFAGKATIAFSAVMMLLAALLLLLARYTGLAPGTLTALGLAFEIVPMLVLLLILVLYDSKL